MEERNCITCKYQGKTHEEEPCKYCSRFHGIKWEPKEKKNCENCRHKSCPFWEWPCNECILEGLDYSQYWEPQEAEDEEKEEEKGKKIELKKRPALLAIPVPIYERTDSEIPEKVRISFTNGTSAIYALHVDQPKPLVMESIRIIRKWRSEEYQYVPARRRRSRK